MGIRVLQITKRGVYDIFENMRNAFGIISQRSVDEIIKGIKILPTIKFTKPFKCSLFFCPFFSLSQPELCFFSFLFNVYEQPTTRAKMTDVLERTTQKKEFEQRQPKKKNHQLQYTHLFNFFAFCFWKSRVLGQSRVVCLINQLKIWSIKYWIRVLIKHVLGQKSQPAVSILSQVGDSSSTLGFIKS